MRTHTDVHGRVPAPGGGGASEYVASSRSGLDHVLERRGWTSQGTRFPSTCMCRVCRLHTPRMRPIKKRASASRRHASPSAACAKAPMRTCADQRRSRAKGREAGGAGAGCGPRRAGASSWARRASRQRSGRVRKRVRGADWKSKMRSDRAKKSARPGRMHARAEECAESVSSAYLGTQTQGPTQFHSGRRCTSRSPSPRCSCCRSGRPCTTMQSPG